MRHLLSRTVFLLAVVLPWAQLQAEDPPVRGDASLPSRALLRLGPSLSPAQARYKHIRTLAFTADGKTLVAVSDAGLVSHWDPASGRLRRQLVLRKAGRDEGNCDLFALSPDARYLATRKSRGAPVRLWDASEGKWLHDFEAGPPGRFSVAVFSADGSRLAVFTQATLHLWEVPTGRNLGTWQTDELLAVALSPDGRRLAVAEQDVPENGHQANASSVRIEDLVKHRLRGGGTLPSRVRQLAFSPDGLLVAVAAENQPFSLLAADTGRERLGFSPDLPQHCTDLLFSPDGRCLASLGGERVELWELASGDRRCVFHIPHGTVTALAFSPDGRVMATSTQDASILLWDLTGRLPARGKERLSEEEQQKLWQRLDDPDAARGYQAIGRLLAYPEDALSLLRHLDRGHRQQVEKLIAQLDADEYESREKAEQQLRRLGSNCRAALEEAHKTGTPEMNRRIDRLLRQLRHPGPDLSLLRPRRVLEVLERLATPEARALLEELADTHPDATLRNEARAALRRLAARP
jgi:hypothetical protein